MPMLYLIAESKTMTASPKVACDPSCTTPCMASEADELVAALRDIEPAALAHELKISPTLTSRLLAMLYDFPASATASPAIESFTGVVFKALSYSTLSDRARAFADSRIRIISSLYGYLRPRDAIKPYRLDFAARLAPGDMRIAEWLKQNATRALLDEIDRKQITDIVNLMPADATLCLDMPLLMSRVRVWRPDFRQIVDAGATKTPNSHTLKTLRGKLLRQAVTEGADTPDSLCTLEATTFIPPAQVPEHTQLSTSQLPLEFITA